MVIIKNRLVDFLIIMAAIILFDLVSFEIAAMPADNPQIIIDKNLKTGMALKDAIDLLGPPEKIKISKTGTVVVPYDELGLSIEVMNDSTVIEKIDITPSFKGKFASGIEIGADFQKILSAYDQPEMMTKDVIEYSEPAMKFKIHEGKLTGAVFYSAKSILPDQITNKEPAKNELVKVTPAALPEKAQEDIREALREEMRDEVREEVLEEVNKEVTEDFDVFDLFGFKVKQLARGVVITEITPGSAAEKGGLKKGEPVRKAFYKGAGKMNIYSAGGLEAILKRSVTKHKKVINILQTQNYYYKVEVPKRK